MEAVNVNNWPRYPLGKEGYFYIAPGKGNGDLLYNTCRMIIETNDKSQWAVDSLVDVFDCLIIGIRWPDDMAEHIHTITHRQDEMTQDPWIMAYACAVHLNMMMFVEAIKPSVFFWLPDKWAWRRALLGKRNLYRVWRIITRLIPKQWFVETLYYYMEWAYQKTIR